MVQKIKENISAILLGLLLAAISIIGLINKSHLDLIYHTSQRNFDQMWAKLDRVTSLMMAKEESIRNEQRILKEEIICIGKEMEKAKTKIDMYHPNGNKK